MTRFTSRFLVDLLIRETEAAGGFAAVLAAGDDHSGSILVQCSDRGVAGPLLERRFAMTGKYVWEAVGPDPASEGEERESYQTCALPIFAMTGGYVWEAVGPDPASDGEERANYQDRRRKADPDLWIVELDIADAPRLVAEWGALT